MFALLRALFFGALALVVLVPVAIVLSVIGLPVAAVLGVLALPVLAVLFIVGLPLLIVGGIVLGLLGAVFGLLMAFLSVGILAIKVAALILIPLLILSWIGRRLFGGREALGR